MENLGKEEKFVYTIGYEGLTIEEYIDKLKANNIPLVIDVRNNPVSRKKGFSKRKFEAHLNNAGINYIHIPELGIPKHLRDELKDISDYIALFDYYEKHILKEKALFKAYKILLLLREYRIIAITCFEKDHNYCHRSKISNWVMNSNKDSRVIHI